MRSLSFAEKYAIAALASLFMSSNAQKQYQSQYQYWHESEGVMSGRPSAETLKRVQRSDKRSEILEKLESVSAPTSPSQKDRNIVRQSYGTEKLVSPKEQEILTILKAQSLDVSLKQDAMTSAIPNSPISVGIDRNRLQKRNMLKGLSLSTEVRRHLYRYSQCGARSFEAIVLTQEVNEFKFGTEVSLLVFTYDCAGRCLARYEKVKNGQALSFIPSQSAQRSQNTKSLGLSEHVSIERTICDALWNGSSIEVDGL